MRARKRPVEVEVMLLTAGNLDEVAAWCGGQAYRDWIAIPTLEGDMQAGLGDYVIRGVAGEFYPCKPDIFNRTYDLVPDALQV